MLIAYAKKASPPKPEEKSIIRVTLPPQGGEVSLSVSGMVEVPITPGVFPKPLVVKKNISILA